ncbi:unnamed protein product [[Candida] boidinii]|nr:unnamed protein product [[Candida] boidinii]
MSSSPAPPALPQRRQVPPAYDPTALLPGFSDDSSRDRDSLHEPTSPRKTSSVNNNIQHPVVPLPRRAPPPSGTPPPGFSMSVMQPSRSLNGTPVSTPPPPPPRRSVTASTSTSASTDEKIDHYIPTSKFSASGKLAPMVPIKPKNLSSTPVHSNENITPITSSTTNNNSTLSPTTTTPTWTAMVPNKKL